jgi:hypothetical protein
MKKGACLIMLAGLLPAMAAAETQAASVAVDAGTLSPVVMDSVTIPTLLSDADPHSLSSDDLGQLHDLLRLGGVNANGIITMVLTETAHGLSLFTLIDDSTSLPTGDLNLLDIVTVGSTDNGWFVNDRGGDSLNVTNKDGERRIEAGFRWRDNRADGMVWTDLEVDDELSFEIRPVSGMMTNGGAVQLLTWGDNGWTSLEVIEFDGGPFSFGVTVIPAPAAGMALFGLALARGRRRRR